MSEVAENRVLLIEAGGNGAFDPTLKVPMMTALLLRGNRHVWRYQTRPEPGLNGRRIDLPRGKVLGGSSAINGMVYVRGLSLDYDLWAQQGMPEWSWDAVEPVFRKSEHFLGPGDPKHHGTNGELTVSRRKVPVSPLAQAFIDAGIAAGYPQCADFNAPGAKGFGYYHFTTKNGRRVSAATAFLKSRPNLTIQANCEVRRLIVNHDRINGVELNAGNVHAQAGVILCAGAIGSPMLLLRSGIGPADELAPLGIEPILDLPEVGRNLQDHVLIRVGHTTGDEVSLHRLTRIDRAAFAFLQAWLTGTGPMNIFPLEAGAYLPRSTSPIPEIQSHFIPALTSATLRFNPFATVANAGPGFMANASVMRPVSRGWIKLTSPEPAADPDIQMNYLSEPPDLDTLADAVEILRDVFSQKPMDRYRGPELDPGPDIKSRAGIAQWVRQTASTMHHMCGTCRMGADESSVVDPQLRLRGLAGLHIADASIFPAVTSSNTAAPTMMVAEKAAAILVGKSI